MEELVGMEELALEKGEQFFLEEREGKEVLVLSLLDPREEKVALEVQEVLVEVQEVLGEVQVVQVVALVSSQGSDHVFNILQV